MRIKQTVAENIISLIKIDINSKRDLLVDTQNISLIKKLTPSFVANYQVILALNHRLFIGQTQTKAKNIKPVISPCQNRKKTA